MSSTVTSPSSIDPAAEGLIPLGGRPPLRHYLVQLWARRQFAMTLAKGDLRSRHAGTILGSTWHLINPLLLIGVYYLIFGRLLNADRGVDNFVGFLAIGVFAYTFVQRTITDGAGAIVNNVGLLRSLQFPRAILPIAGVIRESLAHVMALLVMAVVLLLTGEPVTLGWLMLVPITLGQMLFALGGAFITARLTDNVRDVRNLLPFVFRLLFYLSGVLFMVDAFAERYTAHAELLKTLFILNPFYVFVSLPREYLMADLGHDNLGPLWISAVVWTVVLVVVGFAFFVAAEKRYGRG